jgi:TolA-binding protein
VSRITRKELKSDKFALEVEHTVTFFEEHRDLVIRYAAIGLALLLLVLAYQWYSRSQHAAREAALSNAMLAQEAPVGDANPNAPLSFPTDDAKQQEASKRFTEVLTKYSGSDQGSIAEYYLGTILMDQGKQADAEKRFQHVADTASDRYASLAKLALAQIYVADGRTEPAEKILRALMDSPTAFVSKEQATLQLAQAIKNKKPAEARKLVEPMRTIAGPVGQLAITLYGEIPAQ